MEKKKEKNTSQEIEKAKMMLEMTGFVNILDGRDIKKSIRGFATSLDRKNKLRNRIEVSIDQFVKDGGKIKHCPYFESKKE